MPLWEGLKSVTEACFSLWSLVTDIERGTFVREALVIKERCAGEGQELVFAALKNPLQVKAVARALLLGHNFLRTLDICLEAMLRFPSQRLAKPKPVKTEVLIDWAVGGIREWPSSLPYAFELSECGRRPLQPLAHISRHYSTDRSERRQISHKQIANIFMLRDTTVADLERRGLAQLRESLMSALGPDCALSELTQRYPKIAITKSL